jgi:hypothetical protein
MGCSKRGQMAFCFYHHQPTSALLKRKLETGKLQCIIARKKAQCVFMREPNAIKCPILKRFLAFYASHNRSGAAVRVPQRMLLPAQHAANI